MQKTLKSDPGILWKRFPWKVDFCKSFHAKTTILKSQTPKILVRNRYKKPFWNDHKLKNKINLKHVFEITNWHKQVPKSFPHRSKSCYLQTRVHPAAAPMVLQGGPEVPKWLPKVLPRCQNGFQHVEKVAPRPQMTPKWRSREAKGSKKDGAGGRGRRP